MLEIEDVSKTFGPVRALDGCVFTAAPKRLTGLLGPNGAGKTTLMRCLLGLVEADHGVLRWRENRAFRPVMVVPTAVSAAPDPELRERGVR